MQTGTVGGRRFTDDRGVLTAFEMIPMEKIQRFYTVQNHKAGFVRAWHGHKFETKYAVVVKGAAVVAAVKVDNWESPNERNDTAPIVEREVLSAENAKVFLIPAGCANGWKSLTDDTIIVFFSTATAEESKGDDYRFPARLWDVWGVEER
jgi:dTDP-4-dehydrorhamnose 3,5-epimerase-like enzyme